MARGITDTDVHTAADELVAAGERPTVERIRAHLGTGSPNTVTRHLDTWWQELGRRLHTQQVRLALPDAPDAVAALAGQWWVVALDSAKASLQASLAADRQVLEEERSALHRQRERLEAEATALRAQTEAAGQAERIAKAQVAELQRLAGQLQRQVNAVEGQRDMALIRINELESVRDALQLQLQQLQEVARVERETLSQHVRAVEDRSHAEVDRARREANDANRRVAALSKEHAALERTQVEAIERARTATFELRQELAAQQARADALEAQMAKFKDLPTMLEAAWRELGRQNGLPAAKPTRSRRTSGKAAPGR